MILAKPRPGQTFSSINPFENVRESLDLTESRRGGVRWSEAALRAVRALLVSARDRGGIDVLNCFEPTSVAERRHEPLPRRFGPSICRRGIICDFL